MSSSKGLAGEYEYGGKALGTGLREFREEAKVEPGEEGESEERSEAAKEEEKPS